MSESGQRERARKRKMASFHRRRASMSFRIVGLEPAQFRHYFEMSDSELREAGARRVLADSPTLPCRVSMRHAQPGEELVLVNYEHLPVNSPYRARHAIFVRKAADQVFDAVDTIPEVMALPARVLAARGFDAEHMLIEADIVNGGEAADVFERMLANPRVRYLQVHNAKHGCYSGRVERAGSDYII
jgi:hypothetical protein